MQSGLWASLLNATPAHNQTEKSGLNGEEKIASKDSLGADRSEGEDSDITIPFALHSGANPRCALATGPFSLIDTENFMKSCRMCFKMSMSFYASGSIYKFLDFIIQISSLSDKCTLTKRDMISGYQAATSTAGSCCGPIQRPARIRVNVNATSQRRRRCSKFECCVE